MSLRPFVPTSLRRHAVDASVHRSANRARSRRGFSRPGVSYSTDKDETRPSTTGRGLMKDNESDRFSDGLIAVYRKTVNSLYEFVSRRSGGSRELAEDVTQETYLRAAATWPKRGLPDCPIAWLQTVARNLLLNHYRRRHPEPLASTDIDTVLGSAASDDQDAAALVCWGLARLSARHARVLEAFYIDGRPARSIADEFGVTERAIEGRLRRARHALKKLLAPHVGANGEVT